MRLSLALLSVALLAACAGMNTFDNRLHALEGRPVNDAAIAFGGKHTGEYVNDAGETVYVWHDRARESLFGTRVTSGAGYQIGSRDSHGDAFLWSGIEYHSCVIRVATRDGIIQRVTSEGDPGGCEYIHGAKKRELGYDSSQRP